MNYIEALFLVGRFFLFLVLAVAPILLSMHSEYIDDFPAVSAWVIQALWVAAALNGWFV